MSEQLLMRQYAYPQYDLHTQEHDRLMEQAYRLQQEFAAAGEKVTQELITGLRQWLLDHMSGQDRALEKYLEKYGPSPDRQTRSSSIATTASGPLWEKA